MSESTPIPATAHKSPALHGAVRVPGDKSISHRALILASQALGKTRIRGLLTGEDVIHTANALRALGVDIEQYGDEWVVEGLGIGGLQAPSHTLDMGNAGTGARLIMGLLAAYPFSARLTGDASLQSRPMSRVMTPLRLMGAQFDATENERLPITTHGSSQLKAITYTLPMASAQVKSAILLSALNTSGTTRVIEPEASRDHTERMLRFFDIPISHTHKDGAHVWSLEGRPAQSPKDREIIVPADPSSAAFPLVAALLVEGSEITLTDVCLNPLRTGLFKTLLEMGAHIDIRNQREVGGEPVGDIHARYSPLRPVDVPAERAPSMIDEYPILAMAAAMANGRSTMHGLGELRVKESNRLNAIIDGLHACGVDAYEEGDNLVIQGRATPPEGGATVRCHHDHRIAMSFLVLGLASKAPISVDDTRAIATSFPHFIETMEHIGAAIHAKQDRPIGTRSLVIAVDGPAASGKGTLARRLADHFNMAYLDTGSLYRAVAMRLVYANKDPDDVPAAIAAAHAIQDHDLANPKLRSERIGNVASKISAITEVREALLEYQRSFAKRPGGAVLDGRDIGTVICPDADYKFFITASIDARTTRRHKQLNEMGFAVAYDAVKEDLLSRDARDAKRDVAPLKPAEDALQIDTTEHSANEVFNMVLAHISENM
jgi:3-phosphoshikimate 1-carboxyvinyltransferase